MAAAQATGRERRPAGGLEGEVLAVLWSAGRPLTVVDVRAACSGDLAYNTVHTILSRLLTKDRVRRVRGARRSTYEPVKDAAEVAADQMRAALSSGVDHAEVLTRFVTALNPADEAMLRAALDSAP